MIDEQAAKSLPNKNIVGSLSESACWMTYQGALSPHWGPLDKSMIEVLISPRESQRKSTTRPFVITAQVSLTLHFALLILPIPETGKRWDKLRELSFCLVIPFATGDV